MDGDKGVVYTHKDLSLEKAPVSNMPTPKVAGSGQSILSNGNGHVSERAAAVSNSSHLSNGTAS